MTSDTDLLTCDICIVEFDSINRIPKNFPCGHCYCEQCVCRMSADCKSIKCPKCRKEFHINDATFTTNYILCGKLNIITKLSKNI